MRNKIMIGALILFFGAIAAYAQEKTSADLMITNMTTYLKLTDDEVNKVRPIIENYMTKWQELMNSLKDGTAESSSVYSQMHQLRETATAQLSKVLTPEQMKLCQQSPKNCVVMEK